MIQDFIDLKKVFFFIVISFSIFSQKTAAQVVSEDTTSFTIENPLEAVPQKYKVLGIEVIGLTTTRPDFVISQLGFNKGDTITIPGDDISSGIERLYRTGLFPDIEIRRRTTTEGIYVQVIVKEQPRLQTYELRGIKGSQKKDIREKLNLLPGFAVTTSSKVQAVNTIKRFYKEKGYWFTKVDVSTGKVDTVRNRVTLYFDVDAGERLEIKDISFNGNKAFSDGKLVKSLGKVKEDKWWQFFSKKLYKEDEYETGKEKLRAFYGQNGYLDFRILKDTVYTFPYNQNRLFVFNTPATGLKVNMTVSEGPQYKVRDINWDGNTVYSDTVLTQVLGFEKGDIFNNQKFDQNLHFSQGGTDVTGLYNDAGYLFFSENHDIEIVGKDSVDINFYITEDEIATIKEVSFTGNTKTHDDVVRRTLRTIPGNNYSRSAIVRTIRELGTLGYFRPETINPVLNPDHENKTVGITYQLDESQSTDNFEFSGGFGGRGIGVILSARVNFNNFSLQRALKGEGWNPVPSGDGQKLSIGAQISGQGFQSYNLSFQEPWLGGKPNSLGVSFSYDLIDRIGTDERNQLFSSSVSLGRRLKWPDDYFTQSTILSYQLYDISGGASFLAEGASSILSLKEVIERNSLDNFVSPTTGSKIQLSGEIAPPLPGFSQFYKIKSLYENHTTITGKLVLTNSVQYGYLGYLGNGQRSNFKRFVLGGTQLQQRQSFVDDNIDLRGYPGGRGQSISPREINPDNGTLDEIGGRLFSKYSLELRIPAIQEQQVQVIPYTFFDAGNSYRNFEDFAPFKVKRATGFGLRVFLPILGLVDLSYGYRLDGIPGTMVRAGEWEFLFNLGAPF